MILMKKSKYSEDLVKWLKMNYKGTRNEVIAEIERIFGIKLTLGQLHGLITKIRMTEQICELAKNQGRKPYKPGTIEKRNGTYIVLSDGTHYNYNRYIYEKAFGKQPDNYIMMYLDGNSKNNALGNMFMLSRRNSVFIRANRLIWRNKTDLRLYCLMSDLASETPHYKRPKKKATS